ncbi:MAG: replicative DNA helicase [Magnetococcales bacterium]|nr:replicative DNA helicase [Magnetococcales bacterium]
MDGPDTPPTTETPDTFDPPPFAETEEIASDRPRPTGEPQRRPAFSLEAEQSVLGAILLDNSVVDQVADILEVEDFYVGAHRVAYRGMLTLLERGEPADPVLLRQYLENNAELESVGGPGYLAELVNTVPTAANARAYAQVVHDKSVLRDLARQATAVVDLVYAGQEPVDAILDEAEQRIFGVAEGKEQRRSGYFTLKSLIRPALEYIEELADRKNAVTGVPTGYKDLDEKLTGLQKSDLVIVAGRPAMGKTSLALNFAANAALDHGRAVGVFSLEMSKEQLVMRLLSATARVDAQVLRTGRLNNDDYGRLIQASKRLAETAIYIDDTSALSVMELRAKARRLRREREIDLIIVDYLQLMRSTARPENRVQEISQISQGLKAVAKELAVPVVAVSQLSRSPESRTDHRPILSDLRESGSIEQDADVVMFVFREEYYKPDDPALTGRAEVNVAKQRNGPTGMVPLTFLHKFTRFENHAKSRDH